MSWNVIPGFTHIKEAASVLQDKLTGVGFVLAVVHIDVELISLKKGTVSIMRQSLKPRQILEADVRPEDWSLTQVTKQWPTSSGSCS